MANIQTANYFLKIFLYKLFVMLLFCLALWCVRCSCYAVKSYQHISFGLFAKGLRDDGNSQLEETIVPLFVYTFFAGQSVSLALRLSTTPRCIINNAFQTKTNQPSISSTKPLPLLTSQPLSPSPTFISQW